MRAGLGWAVFILAWGGPIAADGPLPPPAAITRCSLNGKHCATADPKADSIVVYDMNGMVRGATLWTVRGWHRIFDIADDGEDLVVCFGGVNLLPLDYKPDLQMVSFFHMGQLVRHVPLRELVLDLSKLQRTVSHYEWGQCVGFRAEGEYEVRTVDRGLLRFATRTGRLIQ